MPKTKRARVIRHAPVQKVSSEEAAARDEGPRLIPLEDEGHGILKSYSELADIALGRSSGKRQG
jgi:hypothetical protein